MLTSLTYHQVEGLGQISFDILITDSHLERAVGVQNVEAHLAKTFDWV